MNLNFEQREAIATREGVYCLLATAGSGKTSVLTQRIQGLLAEGNSPDDILALTFTKNAAAEMAKRVGIENTNLRGGMRTFHSLGLRIIQDERRHLPFGLSDSPLPEGPILSKLLSDAMRQFGVPKSKFKEVRGFISKNKRTHTAPADALAAVDFLGDDSYAKIYGLYESRLRDGGMLDFDDLIVLAVQLLDKAEIHERWQFKWVLCDEGQDTDGNQFKLLQRLSAKHGNVFIVGDFSQALYSFRGAEPQNLLEIKKWWPNAQTMFLPQNYRSDALILRFIKENCPIQDEFARSIRTDREDGAPVEFKFYRTEEEEAESVVSAALFDPGNSTVLARTNAQLADFETVCTLNNVKFHLLGKAGFWHQSEVQQVVRLAGFALGSAPPKGFAQEATHNLRNKLRTASAESAVKTILDASGLESMYASTEYAEEDNFAIKNLRKLVQIAARFSNLAEFVKHARKAEHASRKSKNALTLSTAHQAKGLEWHNVFVVGVTEGKMPHEKGDLEEEKRVFYVAASRAAKKLQFSWSGQVSRFLVRYVDKNLNVNAPSKIEAQMGLFG